MLDLSDYVLDLSDYAGMSNVLSNAWIALCLLQGYMCTLVGGFTYRTQNNRDHSEPFDVNSILSS